MDLQSVPHTPERGNGFASQQLNAVSQLRLFGLFGIIGAAFLLAADWIMQWFAAVNPSLMWFATIVFRYVPAPFGGLLAIGSGNIIFLLMFVTSTVVLWYGGVSVPSISKRPHRDGEPTILEENAPK